MIETELAATNGQELQTDISASGRQDLSHLGLVKTDVGGGIANRPPLDAISSSAPLPPPDLLDLAFFLVVDNRASPDLLTGLTAGGLRYALEAYRGPSPGLLPGDMLGQLKTAYLGLEPDPLWKAWNLETGSDTLPVIATELMRTAWAKLPAAGNA